ncbi:MAG: hypothetical protein IKH01_04885 [Prevotella sp.]|nr:hypothetical protein [Prevotella sp.]MBR3079132.1 hypothetical protein [Prevotella sp.]
MQKVEKNLPKATAEVVREYDELQQKLNGLDPSWSDEDVKAASERLYELENNYDWFNVEFTEPTTGKKGLKTVRVSEKREESQETDRKSDHLFFQDIRVR